METVGVILSLCISAISLLIAILSYRLKIPKIKIKVMNKKIDCFFGNVHCEHNGTIFKSRVSGVKLRILNNSPSEITIMDIALKCRKEVYRLINCTNAYWETVEFVFPDKNGEESSDGTAIYYANEGIILPLNLKAYDGKDIVALFYNFPINIANQTEAKVIVQTSVGVKTKRLNLNEYNGQWMNDEYRDYLQYLRSIEDNEEQ